MTLVPEKQREWSDWFIFVISKKYNKKTVSEPAYQEISAVLKKPVQYAALHQFRGNLDSALTIKLNGHGAPGFKGLADALLTEIIDDLIKSWFRTEDTIFLARVMGQTP